MASIFDGRFSSFHNLAVIIFLKNIIIPPPWAFLSRRQGIENPSVMNCESGNDSSIFVSEMIRISISENASDANVSNLFVLN